MFLDTKSVSVGGAVNYPSMFGGAAERCRVSKEAEPN